MDLYDETGAREARETAEVASWTDDAWERRVRWFEEEEGMTRSDAQAAADAEAMDGAPSAEERAAMDALEAEGERQAELAAERFYENGGHAWAAIQADDDHERELELYDEGLQELRAGRTIATAAGVVIAEQRHVELDEPATPSHEFDNGVRCYDPNPIVWANGEDCLHAEEGPDERDLELRGEAIGEALVLLAEGPVDEETRAAFYHSGAYLARHGETRGQAILDLADELRDRQAGAAR